MKVEDIKDGIYVKRLTMIFLVKGLRELESDKYKHYKKKGLESKYIIEYYFGISTKTIKCENKLLHEDSFTNPISEDDLNDRVRLATEKEIEILNNVIKEKHLNSKISNTVQFSEDKCIEYLKSKGYSISKQF